MKKIINWFILRYYLKEIREITKTPVEEEQKLYLMRSPEESRKLLKTVLTAQIIKHFEATNEEERMMAKGAATVLKIIKDASDYAWTIEKITDPDLKLDKWKKFKKFKAIT